MSKQLSMLFHIHICVCNKSIIEETNVLLLQVSNFKYQEGINCLVFIYVRITLFLNQKVIIVYEEK